MKDDRLGIRINKGVLRKLNDLCEENERSKTAQIEELIKDEWKRTHKKDKKC